MPKIKSKPSHVFSSNELADMCANGSKLKKYKIVKSTWNDQPVAIKRYRIKKELMDENNPNIWDEYFDLTSFQTELAIFNKLKNGEINFIKCFGHGSYQGTHYVYHCLVMPFLSNGDLYHYIDTNNPLSWRKRLSMMKGLTNAVSYLHNNNYVHVDIKSPNLLVTDSLKIRLTDFQATQEVNSCIFFSTMTWQAPELFDFFSEVTFACDVYSTAVVLWELATWKHPFNGQNLSENDVFKATQQEPREPIPSDCPADIARLITWGWKVDPKARPSIQQMTTELRAIKPPAIR